MCPEMYDEETVRFNVVCVYSRVWHYVVYFCISWCSWRLASLLDATVR